MSHANIIEVALPVPLNRTFDYIVDKNINVQIGMRVTVPFGKRTLTGVIWQVKTQSQHETTKLKAIKAVIDDTPILDEQTIKLCTWASRYYHHPVGEVITNALPSLLRKDTPAELPQKRLWQLTELGQSISSDSLKRAKKQAKALALLHESKQITDETLKAHSLSLATLKQLHQKGWVTETLVDESPHLKTHAVQSPLTLNYQQHHAVDTLSSALGSYQTFLLEGITGSGKTEVYLQVIEQVIKAEKQVLILVPEIGLTPQMIERFEQRFGNHIAISHSKVSDRARLNTWLKAKRGHHNIVIGTRSAIFTPFKSLGLIIIDEEHDLSYKQQDGFRYSCRDIAIVKAQQHDVPVILGSATPSLESLYNAQTGKSIKLKLTERAGNATPPDIHIIDSRNTKARDVFAPKTLETINQHIARGHQVLFFLNQRGFSPVFMCHACGTIVRCRHCDANMVLHQNPPKLKCHHCDATQIIPKKCGHCAHQELSSVGVGSQQLEHKLTELFPQQPALRVDKDSTQKKGEFEAMLEQIHSGEVKLLIGTQMIAKGHHFPNVTLVVILNVDTGLFSIDYRATERLGQLITQVAGRAGRAEHKGEVLIQTHHPQHQALRTLIESGYGVFAETLLQERQAVGLPPYSHQILLKAEAHSPSKALNFLHHLKTITPVNKTKAIDVWGPIPAFMEKRAGKFRAQLSLQHAGRAELHNHLNQLLHAIEQQPDKASIRLYIDVDPQEVL